MNLQVFPSTSTVGKKDVMPINATGVVGKNPLEVEHILFQRSLIARRRVSSADGENKIFGRAVPMAQQEN